MQKIRHSKSRLTSAGASGERPGGCCGGRSGPAAAVCRGGHDVAAVPAKDKVHHQEADGQGHTEQHQHRHLQQRLRLTRSPTTATSSSTGVKILHGALQPAPAGRKQRRAQTADPRYGGTSGSGCCSDVPRVSSCNRDVQYVQCIQE